MFAADQDNAMTTSCPDHRLVRASVWILLALGLTIRLVVSWQDLAYLIESHVNQIFLIDDTFISHQIARNLARGLGMTFDGIHPTNGFQPLYVFLLVPLYKLIPDDPRLPVHLALSGLSLANAACGLVLYRLTRLFAPAAGALFGLAVWSLSPDVVRLGINGLETSLATLSIALALLFYLTRIRLAGSWLGGRLALLGLLLGLSILARLDAACFAIAVGLDLLLRGLRCGGLRTALRAAAIPAVVAAAVVLPWFAVSAVEFDSIVPSSGEAVRFATLDRYEHQPPTGFYARNFLDSAATLLDNPALPSWRALSGRDYQLPEWPALLVNGPLLLLLVLFAVAWERTADAASTNSVWQLGWLVAYAALTVAAYSCWIFGNWFYPRYYYTLSFLTILLVSIAVGRLFALLRARRRAVVALATGLTLLVSSGFLAHWRTLVRRQAGCGYYNVASWIGTHVPERVTVGAFQSGVLGYFLRQRVINLDGVVNRDALDALRREEIFEYIRQQRIGVVADWEWVVEVSLVRNSKRTRPDMQRLAKVCGAVIFSVRGEPWERADRAEPGQR